jgi:hypothetical protein
MVPDEIACGAYTRDKDGENTKRRQRPDQEEEALSGRPAQRFQRVQSFPELPPEEKSILKGAKTEAGYFALDLPRCFPGRNASLRGHRLGELTSKSSREAPNQRWQSKFIDKPAYHERNWVTRFQRSDLSNILALEI